MKCPECGGEQYCPCRNCASGNAGKVTWVWDDTGELISCGHCGHTMHADGWQNEESKQVAATDTP